MSVCSRNRRSRRRPTAIIRLPRAIAPPPTVVQAGNPGRDVPGDRRRLRCAAEGTLRRRVGRHRWRARRRAARAGLPTPRARSTTTGAAFGSRESPTRTKALTGIYEQVPVPRIKRLMRYAGLDPDHGLLRWGNYNRTLLLPSTIFEADDTGRSYRLRPCTESIWLRQISIERGVLDVLPGSRSAGPGRGDRGTAAIPVERIAAEHQLLGPARPRARPRRTAAGHRPGRLLHAGDVHRRRRHAAGVPAGAISKTTSRPRCPS